VPGPPAITVEGQRRATCRPIVGLQNLTGTRASIAVSAIAIENETTNRDAENSEATTRLDKDATP
jgi:hypothetical protein